MKSGVWLGGMGLLMLMTLTSQGAPRNLPSGGLKEWELTREWPVTRGPGGRILTHTGVWSPDSRWVVYDTRSDPAGQRFDGTRIEAIQVETGEVRVLYTSQRGANCGVATWHPREWRVVFIRGPEHPAAGWDYGPARREGVMVDWRRPELAVNLDARDLSMPGTPGALRGGSHVHVFSPDGALVSFTYEDHLLAVAPEGSGAEPNQRNVGVSEMGRPVAVDREHPRNHDGVAFSVLVTRTVASPRPGSDEMDRAYEEGWVGTNGYVRRDGTRQRRALAFQGQVRTEEGTPMAEVFVVDVPEDLTRVGVGPLEGTITRRPSPPEGVVQRRLTRTGGRKHPGIAGPRHWLRSSPDGSRIAFLMRDDGGVVQLWTVATEGGEPVPITRNPWDIASAFSWSADGEWIAHAMDGSVWVTRVATGEGRRLTRRVEGEGAPRPEACVISPDGRRIAWVGRSVEADGRWHNQIRVIQKLDVMAAGSDSR